MITVREYRNLMKECLVERDSFYREVDLYFSLIEYVEIQMGAKDFLMRYDEIDPNFIVTTQENNRGIQKCHQ